MGPEHIFLSYPSCSCCSQESSDGHSGDPDDDTGSEEEGDSDEDGGEEDEGGEGEGEDEDLEGGCVTLPHLTLMKLEHCHIAE